MVNVGLAKHGGDRKSEAFKESFEEVQALTKGANQRDVITLKRGTQVAYIRARLERDGKTELLAQVDRGEISAHGSIRPSCEI
jgi:hypothetical protein